MLKKLMFTFLLLISNTYAKSITIHLVNSNQPIHFSDVDKEEVKVERDGLYIVIYKKDETIQIPIYQIEKIETKK
jgi:hypothetical protein